MPESVVSFSSHFRVCLHCVCECRMSAACRVIGTCPDCGVMVWIQLELTTRERVRNSFGIPWIRSGSWLLKVRVAFQRERSF